MTEHALTRWMAESRADVGRHLIVGLVERAGAREGVLGDLRTVVSGHYVDPAIMAARLASLGGVATAAILTKRLPATKRARSGEFGEILATEAAEQLLGYSVPVRRLRWKDGREMALRGDDIVGVAIAKKKLMMLKGESKSRQNLQKAVVGEADVALDRDEGRPTVHSVLFVADRLRERNEDDLAEQLERACLNSFASVQVEHLLCTVSGNDGIELLRDHLQQKAKTSRRRHAIAIRIVDHAEFIKTLYEGF